MDCNVIKEIEKDGVKIEIIQDIFNSQNPREWDNLGTIAYKHQSELGDERINEPVEWLAEMLGIEEGRLYNIAEREGISVYSNEMLILLEERFFESYIAKKVYVYEHSGITIKTSPFSCRWDSGQLGYIFVSKEDIRKDFSVNRISKKLREKVLLRLEGEIKTFDQFITGDVYGYVITDLETENEIDSCWGFYGDNVFENGMIDNIPNKYHTLLELL